MRIWLINQFAISSAQDGPARHFSLAREMVRRNHQVTIIASSFDHAAIRGTRLPFWQTWKHEVIEGVSFLWVRTPPYPQEPLRRIWNTHLFGKRAFVAAKSAGMKKPDLIIGSSPHLFAAAAAERLAAHFKVPFVLEVSDVWSKPAPKRGFLPHWRPVLLWLTSVERRLYSEAAAIIAAVPGLFERIAEKGGRMGRVFCLPDGIDTSSMREPSPPERKESGFKVMYAGAQGPESGLDKLLDAAVVLDRVPWGDGICFHLVGNGPEQSRLKRRVLDEGIRRVSFHDAVPEKKLRSILMDADAFILSPGNSNDHQSFGTGAGRVLDYMAAARPIVFCGDFRENPVAEAQSGIKAVATDGYSLAKSLKTLAEMPYGRRVEMGIRGFKHLEENFDIATMSCRLEEILTGVLKSNGK